ncbi:cellulose-binding domain-containing protein [Streptomyces sp. DH24]|uniref:cellulose-binding domain-containing protein n=1 Tax=Streptomyces sp. DH24 TaxID=3040123 RepID=UPI00244144DA|nr:cellulose-binding domain-containing protein [Streptomyces sp. DH24]MDG9715493.1 cellulose-binding domain-containing protein [Streptomyces sp. DH24]
MRLPRHRPRLWAAAVLVAAAGLAGTTLVPQADAADSLVTAVAQAEPGVEDDGADCPVPDPGSPAADSRLPDPFRKLDGTRISTTSDWRCRRAEIKELAERSVYGQKPGKPESVTGTVSRTGITVNVTHRGRTASFSASVDLPSGTGPFPAVVVLGGLGADTATIKASGAAVVNFDPYTVGKEGTPRNNKQGAFYSVYGSSSSSGLLMAWSWGVSRIIDVIEQSGGSVLRADATGVTGCSRFGKGAFAAGAFDQRIDLTMPIESGSAGTGIFRGIPGESGAQPLSSAYSEQPWLGDAFGSFTGNPATLPVDTHEVVAMVAPRGLFVMENPHVDWLGARSGSVAALGGAEVYKALGAGSNISYWSDVQDGTHCAVRPEWKAPLQQSIARFLRDSGTAPGVFRVSPAKAGNLSQWRDWQTPTLTDSGTTGGTTGGSTGGTTGGSTGGTTGGSTGGSSAGSTSGGSTGGGPGEPGAVCTAAYRTVTSWSGGFQGEVTVRNNGTAALAGWTVGMTLASGQSMSSLWNGVHTGTGGSVTVRNTPWNGTVAANGTVTFGFTVNGGSASAPSSLTCASP